LSKSSADTNAVLNHLLVLHNRSLPSYLTYASPWTAGDQRAQDVIDQIAQDQQRFVDRFAELIFDNAGEVYPGDFPMQYTGYNDVSLQFLLSKLIEHQQQLIAEVEHCIQLLQDTPYARAVAEEALGAAKAHYESLQELGEKNPLNAVAY
jgi:hypothetical protein